MSILFNVVDWMETEILYRLIYNVSIQNSSEVTNCFSNVLSPPIAVLMKQKKIFLFLFQHGEYVNCGWLNRELTTSSTDM